MSDQMFSGSILLRDLLYHSCSQKGGCLVLAEMTVHPNDAQ